MSIVAVTPNQSQLSHAFRTVFFSILALFVLPHYGQEYSINQFSLREGLPQSQVECLLEDTRGALWAGTYGGGLARFDGKDFTVLNTSHGLPGNEVNSLCEDLQKRIWIGTDKGVAVWNGLNFIDPLQSVDPVFVHEVFALRAFARMVVATSDSLYLLTDARSPTLVQAVAVDDPLVSMLVHEGQLYACGYRGLYLIDPEDGLLVTPLFETPTLLAPRLVTSETDGLCIASGGNGLLSVTENGLLKIDRDLTDHIYDFIEISERRHFATRDHGLLIRNGDGSLVAYDLSSGLPKNHIKCILADRWGNIWLGSNGGGLTRLSVRPFEHHPTIPPLGGAPQSIYAIAESDSSVYLAVGETGVWRFEDRKLVQDSLLSSVRFKAKALHRDRRDRLWIGTEGDGVYIRSRDTIEHLTGASGISGAWVRDICEDRAGNVWLATLGGGITRVSDEPQKGKRALHPSPRRFTVYTTRNGLADNRIHCIAADHRGRIWYGTGSGTVGCILPDEAAKNLTFNQLDGLPKEEVKSLRVDPSGRIWAAFATGQIWRFDAHNDAVELKQVSAPKHRPYALYAIAFDDDGHLWLGGADGAYRWLLDEEGNVVDASHFTGADGFEGLEVCSNAIYPAENGEMYFGTMAGLTVKTRSNGAADEALRAPTVQLTAPHLFYRPMRELHLRTFVRDWDTPADTIVLTYEQNNLSFDISAVHLSYLGSTLYSHRLDGVDEEWSPLTPRNYIALANLAPGTYTLRSRACVKGQHCAEAAPVTLKVLTPYWMTDRFRYLMMGLAVLLLIAFFLVVLFIIRRRARRRNIRLQMERDLLELEQKALRLQMNPHFIFNTLNSIQGLIAREDPQTARMYLSKFARLMREILQNSREELITLDEELATLTHYLELARFTHENCFTYRIEIEPGLGERMIPPLLLQPFIENAIIHGLVPQGGGEVFLAAYRQDGRMVIVIEDNGVGMRVTEADGVGTHRSAGLAVTRERLRLLTDVNGRAATIRFEVATSGGTRVVLEVVLSDG